MPNRIYIRRIDQQCINKQISFTVDVHRNVFLNAEEFTVIGKRTQTTELVKVLPKSDTRFSGNLKKVLNAELMGEPLSVGDIMVIRSDSKKKDTYYAEMITENDAEYILFDEMCTDDRHAIITASKSGPVETIEVYQLIKYGVPGTGKSFGITQKIQETYSDYKEGGECEYVFRTTLHPEYSYYDFVGSVAPAVNDDGKITYEFNPGIFTLALMKALNPENKDKKIFLVLEEMSRANVASVFGDVFQLLDRNDNGESEYRIKNDLIANYIKKEANVDLANGNIYIPSNMYIYGTVNTSDQNVFVMDNAFKRRFEFEYVGTDPVMDDKNNYINEFEFLLENTKYKWTDFYQIFNSYVIKMMNLREDKQIGPFFLKFKYAKDDSVTDTYNYNQILNKLLQYMWEDVHKCALAEKPLFRDDIQTFADAYIKLKARKNIFCDDFCLMFKPNEENSSVGENNNDTPESEDNGDGSDGDIDN